MRLKQSTACVLSFGPFNDPTDGVTPVTGLVSALDNGTTGIKLSKEGGALTIRHATVTATTYDSGGNYLVTLDTTDVNTLGRLRVQFTDASLTVPVWQDFEVVNANEWDSSFGTSVRKFSDLDQIKTVSQSATDLKDFADTGYDPATHKVAEVVLVDTATLTTTATNLTNAPTAGDFTATMKTSLNAATPAVTVSDKTGFSLSTAGILAIWHQLTSAIVTAGTIGKLVVDNLDAAITSRMATYTQPTGFLAATFPSGTIANTTNITAALLGATGNNAVADAYIARNIAGGSSTGRTNKQVAYATRNKTEIAGGTLTVYEPDDTTPSWDAAVTTAAGNPLSAIDPS